MVQEHLATFASHALAVLTLGLSILLIARLLSERRQPGATFAWLLLIALVPYIGIPLFLLLGGRKIRKLARDKVPLRPNRRPTGPAVSASFRPQFEGAFPPTTGNTVRFLDTGESTFRELCQRIDKARSSIDIQTFILGRDDTGREVVELLARKARSGVRVRLLLDGLGCLTSAGTFADPIRRAGGRVERFMPVLPVQSRWSANLRNHRKIAVFDGSAAMVGGHNLASEYMGSQADRQRWVDFGASIEGAAAQDLHAIFEADWAYATGESPRFENQPRITGAGPSTAQVMAGGPDVPDDTLHEAILSLIQESDSKVWIVTPYFVPDEVLFRTLIVKARTGRDIRLVLPARSNHRIADYARRQFLRDLHRAGVDIRLHRGPMLHAKALLVDDRVGMLGSVNMDARSLLVNFEVGLFLHSPPDVLGLSHWISRLDTHCRRFGPGPREARTGGFGSRLAEDAARLLAPLL